MNKSKEEIIEILKREGMSYKTMTGEYRKVIHEHDFERIAEKILKEETAKDLPHGEGCECDYCTDDPSE